MADERLADRPLPSLSEWLGDGARADGFEAWVRESFRSETIAATPRDAQTMRLFRPLSIAFVEALRRESEGGHDVGQAIQLLPRLAGMAAMCAVISALEGGKKNPPLLKIARILIDEFAAGAKRAARLEIRDRDA